MGLLTGDQILAADDLTYHDEPCPEWGGTVRVRRLGAAERRAFEKRMSGIEDDPTLDTRTLLVGVCACDEAGKPLFTAEQLAALAQKSNVPIVRLFAACKRLNCIGDAEGDAEKK